MPARSCFQALKRVLGKFCLAVWGHTIYLLQILKEYGESGLQPNKQLWSTMVWFYIAARHPEGLLKALDDMIAEGHAPCFRLLDAAVSRLEREGHREGLQKLLPFLGEDNYRNRAAHRKVRVRLLPPIPTALVIR